MTISTKIIIGLSLLAALLIAGWAYTTGKSSLSKKELNAIVSAQEATNKAKDAQIAAVAAANVTLAEAVKAAQADVANLKADIKNIKNDNDKMRKRLETAPPESLVTTAQKQLDSTDIRLVGSKVEFGLVPFRTTVIRLSDWENFTFTLIPKYNETIAGFENTVTRMGAETGGLKTEIALLRDRIASTDQIVKDIKGFIVARDKVTLWKWLKDTGIKVGIGYGLAKATAKK
jgi:type II secretory pathway pseudopilin PulG